MTRREREPREAEEAMTHVDRDPPGDDTMTQHDAELSALLDGALDPDAAAELRARLADEPALGARLARLGEVDGRLRRLAAEPGPDAARLARLRAGVQARIEAATEPPRAAGRAGVVHVLRPRARRLGWVAAALAAGLALYVLVPRSGEGPAGPPDLARGPGATSLPDPTAQRGSLPPVPLAASPPGAVPREAAPGPDAEAPVPMPGAAAPEALAQRSDTGPRGGPADESGEAGIPAPSPDAVAPGDEPGQAVAAADPVLGTASDAELAIAMEYEVLTDLEVIENLEVLEMLAMLDTAEPL
jgi:hypothetical protein